MSWDFIPKVTAYMDNKKEISLWVLVDKNGIIVYTGSTKEIVENYQINEFFKETQIVELKGELNV